MVFFFTSRRRHTRCGRDWSSDVCSSDLANKGMVSGKEKTEFGKLEGEGAAGPHNAVFIVGCIALPHESRWQINGQNLAVPAVHLLHQLQRAPFEGPIESGPKQAVQYHGACCGRKQAVSFIEFEYRDLRQVAQAPAIDGGIG